MAIFLYIVNNVLSQAVFIIGMVVVVGMVAQKKSWDQILPSTLKTMIGFTMINVGGQTLGGALLPLQQMISKIFDMKAFSSDIELLRLKALQILEQKWR